VAKVLQLWDGPHALLSVDDEPIVLQDLLHVDLKLLVGMAADDDVIHPNKAASQSLMALSTCRWKDIPIFLRPKGTLWYSKRPKGGGNGVLLHVRWVDRNLMVPLPQVDVGKNCALQNQTSWAAG
jgi:hypothetical protein